MFTRSNRFWIIATLALTPVLATLLITTFSAASKPTGWPNEDLPGGYQNRFGYTNYSYRGSVPAAPRYEMALPSPTVSALTVAEIPFKHTYEDPTIAYVVAHVPAEAEVYIFDNKKTETGTMRTFGTPTLQKNHDYYYDVTVRWVEDGKWVSQMSRVDIRAGGTYCVYVVDANSSTPAMDKDIAVSFAKLSPDDATAAKKQKNCAVQDGVKLGSMGAPVKVMINGEAVYLCCPACEAAARKDADKVLKSAKNLREKNAKNLSSIQK